MSDMKEIMTDILGGIQEVKNDFDRLTAENERLTAENGGIANAAELLAEDIECVHMWLDDRNVPRFCELTDLEYSIVGRVALLCYGREEKGQIDHLKSQIVNESFD